MSLPLVPCLSGDLQKVSSRKGKQQGGGVNGLADSTRQGFVYRFHQRQLTQYDTFRRIVHLRLALRQPGR